MSEQFFDPNAFNQFNQGQQYAQQLQQQATGFPAGPPAPPQQGYPGYGPPAGQGYYQQQAPQVPPQQAYYGPGGVQQGGWQQGPPQQPQGPMPVAESLDDFYDQAAGAGRGLKFENKGDWYIVSVPRELVASDVRARERNGVIQTDKSGRPKWVLVMPVTIIQSCRPDFEVGEECSWWLSGSDKERLVKALSEAAKERGATEALKVPPPGTGLKIVYTRDKGNGPGVNATKIKEVMVALPEGWTPPVPAPRQQDPTPVAAAGAVPDFSGQASGYNPDMGTQAMPDFPANGSGMSGQSTPGPQSPPWQNAPAGVPPVNTAAPDEAQSSFAQPGQQWSMQPGAHGGPVAMPPQAAPPVQQAAPAAAPAPGDDAIMAQMSKLLGQG